VRTPLVALALAGAVLAPGAPAHAQAYQCAVPGSVSVPRIAPDGPARRMAVTGYSLNLSWSPEYCRGREGSAADRMQCSGRSGRFGLILHGLWPEGGESRWPQWCPTARRPSAELLRRNMCLTPSAQLLAHEWAKHGSCMARTPEGYFKAARILWDSLALPDLDRLSRRQGLTAGAIRQAFTDGNLAWSNEMVGIDLNERGWFEGYRLCYGKDFMPARCGKARFGPPDSASAKIWRGL